MGEHALDPPDSATIGLRAVGDLRVPWDGIALATVMAVAAFLGTVASLLNDRRPLAVVVLAFVPYVAFHLLFQETIFARYALPTMPLLAWLAIRGVNTVGRAARFVAAVVVATSLAIAVPPGLAYAKEPHPAFKAIAAMAAKASTTGPIAVYSHFSLRRPLQAAAPMGSPIVEPRRSYEWLGLVDYWRGGGAAPSGSSPTHSEPISR